MPRGKKTQETSKKRTKKMVEEDDDETLDESDAPIKKNTKKQPTKNSKSKGKKKTESDEEESELSELQVDDDGTNESGENEEVVMSHKRDKQPIKIIKRETPIGDLTVEDILNFLIQKAIADSNPTLKYRMLQVKAELTGHRRKYPQTYGSKRNNFGPNPRFNRGNQYPQQGPGGRGNNNNRGGMQQGSRNSQRPSYPQEELYNDD